MSEQKSPTAIIHLGDTKHIEPGKTYSIEVERLAPLYANEIENIIRTFEEATGAKAVVVQGATVKDSGVVTMPVEELRRLTDTIQRVRELHEPVKETNAACDDPDCCGEYEEWEMCADCQCDYPCPTIKAVDGEIGSVEPVKSVALDGEQS